MERGGHPKCLSYIGQSRKRVEILPYLELVGILTVTGESRSLPPTLRSSEEPHPLLPVESLPLFPLSVTLSSLQPSL